MYYAPVIIPTLCRFDHFKECMESLARNTWAKDTEIYIGLDYPSKEAHREGYDKICKYLEETKFPFKEVNIFKRERNFGVYKNVEDLAAAVRKKHDRYIFTEDDNVFADRFIEYVDTMLEQTKDRDDIYGVCGYSYPIDHSAYESGNANDNENDNEKSGYSYMVRTAFPAWGYGGFFHKRDKLMSEYTHEFLINGIRKGVNHKLIKSLGKIYGGWFVNRACGKEITYDDIDVQLYQTLTGKMSIMPHKTLVKNMGWDGSGVNCQTGSYDFSSQELYVGEISDRILPQDDNREKEIWKFISGLNSLDTITDLKIKIKYILIKLGIKR
ncbi:glycosyltransferase family A protein [Butyrivibrio sp. LB2008]|uniref:glycosyltransferase family A protein n=1 Tax=Butyrivibrio sp. LB2008 TaxID=1408305 RepID=UPI00047C5F6D|nr:glycosyltransferase family A protein [Butyrivibrio sp. LB2008]